MKPGVGMVILVIVIAGCAAPTAGPLSPTSTQSPPPTATPTDTPTASPTPTSSPPTPTGPTHHGIGARITQLNVTDTVVLATFQFTNFGDERAVGDLAFRFVENDSHALIDTATLDPGESKAYQVPLRLYGDDPANLTVQVRVNGTIVAERSVTST